LKGNVLVKFVKSAQYVFKQDTCHSLHAQHV